MDSTLQPVLSWLQHPELQSAGNGVYLRRIVHALVDRSSFWEAFVHNHKYELIDTNSMQCFGWLLLKMLTLTPKVHPAYLMVAEDPLVRGAFRRSQDQDVVGLGKRIERLSNLHKSGITLRNTIHFQPCHDNDFKDITDISIFPTLNEALSDGQPRFLRPSEVEDEKNRNRKVHKYISNLFRTKLEIILFTTAGYAHEPVLGRLQALALPVPFEEEIIFWDSYKRVASSEVVKNQGLRNIVSQLQREPEQDLKKAMKLKTSVSLDPSQAKCLVSSLMQRLSLVQGPPGTGK